MLIRVIRCGGCRASFTPKLIRCHRSADVRLSLIHKLYFSVDANNDAVTRKMLEKELLMKEQFYKNLEAARKEAEAKAEAARKEAESKARLNLLIGASVPIVVLCLVVLRGCGISGGRQRTIRGRKRKRIRNTGRNFALKR